MSYIFRPQFDLVSTSLRPPFLKRLLGKYLSTGAFQNHLSIGAFQDPGVCRNFVEL